MSATISVAHRHGDRAASLLDPVVSHDLGRSEAAARGAHPVRVAAVRVVAGYAVLTLALLGVGWLLVHPLSSSVGRWDDHVNAWFADHRNGFWNGITSFATRFLNTLPVIAIAVIAVLLLSARHRLREAAFLAVALVIEITVFLSVTFVVARPRPHVVRLDSTPATDSFPSGHTAAATVLFAGLAVIVTCCTRSRALRRLAFLLAALIAFLVGFARVYRGMHHPTDVLFGMLYGIGCLVVSALAVRAASTAVEARRERADA